MPKVTALKAQKNGVRINVSLDEKFWIGLSQSTLLHFKLYLGVELDEILQREITRYENGQKLRAKAFDYLSRRGHSVAELRQKLKIKDYDEAEIDLLLQELAAKDYLDDRRFAQTWVKERQGKKGPQRLRAELRQKGVSPETIDQMLSAEVNPDDQYTAALDAAWKRQLKLADEPWSKQYQKIGATLQGKGYDYDLIRRVLSELKYNLG